MLKIVYLKKNITYYIHQANIYTYVKGCTKKKDRKIDKKISKIDCESKSFFATICSIFAKMSKRVLLHQFILWVKISFASKLKKHWHLLRMLKGTNIIALLLLKEIQNDKLKMPFNCSIPQKPDNLLISISKQTPGSCKDRIYIKNFMFDFSQLWPLQIDPEMYHSEIQLRYIYVS